MSFALRALQAACPPDHVYKVALYAEQVCCERYDPDGEIRGAGYEAGGNVLDGYRIELHEAGGATLHFFRTEWVNADILAKSALIYDATTGDVVSIMHFPRALGVTGGLFELKMPDEGVVAIGKVADDEAD